MRLDVNAWIAALRELYELRESPASMGVVLAILRELREKIASLRETVLESVAINALQKWDEEFDSWRAQLDSAGYDLDSDRWETWVVDPWLYGAYPEGYFGEDKPWPWPNATMGAMLWNQLLEAAETSETLQDWWQWDTAHHFAGELLDSGRVYLQGSGDPEDPGLLEEVGQAIEDAKEAIVGVGSSVVKYVLIGVGIVGGGWLLKKLFLE